MAFRQLPASGCFEDTGPRRTADRSNDGQNLTIHTSTDTPNRGDTLVCTRIGYEARVWPLEIPATNQTGESGYVVFARGASDAIALSAL